MKTRIESIAIALLLLTFAGTEGIAQKSADYKHSADVYFAMGDYYSAASYYQLYLSGAKGKNGGSFRPYSIQKLGATKASSLDKNSPSYMEAVNRIAESYRKVGDYKNAETWYQQLSTSGKAKYPDAQLWYGVSLKANGKCADAEQQLNEYVAGAGNNPLVQVAQQELAGCRFAADQAKNSSNSLFTITPFQGGINTGESSFAGTWNNGIFYFTSTRPDTAVTKGNPYTAALYSADATLAKAEKVSVPATKDENQGIASFNSDGSRMYLTKWKRNRDRNIAELYVSEKKGGTWSTPVKLGSDVNKEGFSSEQPYVTPDNKFLVFASDMPGGSGKMDIWYAPLSANGLPGTAVNMGSNVNTAEDDAAPFYQQGSGTLVFASKGRVGMGGYDLFQSKGAFNGSWTPAENLGAPVNTNKDEIYFTTRSNTQLFKDAVISSDRSSDYCMALYTVNKKYKKYIAGTVVDCKTKEKIAGASVSAGSASGVTDATGNYVVEVENFTKSVSASKENYNSNSLDLTAPSGDIDTLNGGEICLALIEKVKAPEDHNVYFDFNKYNLTPATGVKLDTLAALLKRESMLSLEILGYTDNFGTKEYNDKLSLERAEACKQYLIQKGVDASRLSVQAKGACCPLKPETTPDGKDIPEARAVNRRVEFNVKLR
jgi:OmpA-OmpF porin, OOP family